MESIGGLLAPAYPSVPSPNAPGPSADPYFSGGYSGERHTAQLAALQIEANFIGVRDSASSRAAFGSALATALLAFSERHLGSALR